MLELIVIVVPSTLTPPKTVVVAIGREYVEEPPPTEDITPVLELIVIVVPSTLTPPKTVVEAIG